MTFYINEVHLDGVSDYTHTVIGLFDNNAQQKRDQAQGY